MTPGEAFLLRVRAELYAAAQILEGEEKKQFHDLIREIHDVLEAGI